ncbi:MAG: hypothetical protein D4S01_10785 [Dehalococcoidia bacterium]|nr:MAG: hypothetical protein D4S01_10785 [Dehalococcoidia bacterium]
MIKAIIKIFTDLLCLIIPGVGIFALSTENVKILNMYWLMMPVFIVVGSLIVLSASVISVKTEIDDSVRDFIKAFDTSTWFGRLIDKVGRLATFVLSFAFAYYEFFFFGIVLFTYSVVTHTMLYYISKKIKELQEKERLQAEDKGE